MIIETDLDDINMHTHMTFAFCARVASKICKLVFAAAKRQTQNEMEKNRNIVEDRNVLIRVVVVVAADILTLSLSPSEADGGREGGRRSYHRGRAVHL